LPENQARMVRQRLARFGGHDPATASFKQDDTGIGFDIADTLACRSQREIRLSGAGCNAAGIDHAKKQAQICEIESQDILQDRFPSVNPKAASEKPDCSGFWLDM
jgi:hypothetical protein